VDSVSVFLGILAIIEGCTAKPYPHSEKMMNARKKNRPNASDKRVTIPIFGIDLIDKILHKLYSPCLLVELEFKIIFG
jgi:hypothetical protein